MHSTHVPLFLISSGLVRDTLAGRLQLWFLILNNRDGFIWVGNPLRYDGLRFRLYDLILQCCDYGKRLGMKLYRASCYTPFLLSFSSLFCVCLFESSVRGSSMFPVLFLYMLPLYILPYNGFFSVIDVRFRSIK
jgi:hypothetical protein